MNATYPELMTTAEVARLLRVHPNTVRAWAKANQLHSVGIGRGKRFWRDDVLRVLDKEKP